MRFFQSCLMSSLISHAADGWFQVVGSNFLFLYFVFDLSSYTSQARDTGVTYRILLTCIGLLIRTNVPASLARSAKVQEANRSVPSIDLCFTILDSSLSKEEEKG